MRMNQEGEITTTFQEWQHERKESVRYERERIARNREGLKRDVARLQREIVQLRKDHTEEVRCAKERIARLKVCTVADYETAKEKARGELLKFREECRQREAQEEWA